MKSSGCSLNFQDFDARVRSKIFFSGVHSKMKSFGCSLNFQDFDARVRSKMKKCGVHSKMKRSDGQIEGPLKNENRGSAQFLKSFISVGMLP